MSVTDVDVQRVEPQHLLPLERIVGRTDSFADTRGDLGGLVLGGRIVLVWMPAFALVATAKPPLAAVATASVVTALWLVTLRAAFANYFTLGPVVASAVGTITGLVAVSALDLWAPGTDFGTAGLAETAAAVFVLSAAWEYAVRSIVKRRVLIVGTGGCASDVMDELTGDGRAPFTVVGVSHFFEHALGRVPLRHLTPTWFMSMLHLRQKLYTRVAKRTFDLAVASFGLLLVAPLIPVLIALVRTTPGSIIYRQTRLGEGARRFTMYKFRTMRSDAEESGRALFAQERDPRTTRVGRVLRQTHLDEIPQLWNVLRGDMSIVGPRPERPEFVEMLEREVPFWTRRLLVKPGITGWAQLRSSYAWDAASTAEKLSYDLWYLRNRNVVIDLAICVQTVLALLLRRGR